MQYQKLRCQLSFLIFIYTLKKRSKAITRYLISVFLLDVGYLKNNAFRSLRSQKKLTKTIIYFSIIKESADMQNIN